MDTSIGKSVEEYLYPVPPTMLPVSAGEPPTIRFFAVRVGEPPKSRAIRFTSSEYWTTRSLFFMPTANVNALLQNYDNLNRS